MVGSAIMRQLLRDENIKIVTCRRDELDLTNQKAVASFFQTKQIDQVYLAAAKVGGIHANHEYPAEFIYENLMIQSNIIHQAYLSGVQQLLFLGSSCIYPKLAQQPINEAALLTGQLEPTNEPYAIAKIAGIKLCESYNRQYGVDYRSIMPTNLYGPGDNFHEKNSHVIPAMMCRFHEAKVCGERNVIVWGSGTPMREFLHVDDMAAACIHVMNLNKNIYHKYTEPMKSHLNVGTGVDCTIRELAETMRQAVDFKGEIMFDTTKPDGTPRKLLDTSRLQALQWRASITLREGLDMTYQWFIENRANLRAV